MQDNHISCQQLAFLVFMLLPGSSLVFLTGKAAAQDAWIATILGLMFGLYVLYTILKLYSIFPGLRVTQISTALLGRIPGTLLNILFFCSIFIILITFLFDINMVLQIIYPLISSTAMYTLLILTCSCCLYKGMTALGRLGELSIWISLFLLLAGFLLALPLINLSNLKPVLAAWKPLIAGTLYAADWPFDEVVIFGLFLPLVSDLKGNLFRLYWWYVGGGLVLLLLDFEMLSILGAKLSNIYQFPLFEVFRLSGFGDFQRVELLFFVLWFITGIITIMIYYQSLGFIVQDIFSLQEYKALILPLGLCLIVFTLYMFPNTVEYQLLGFKYTPVYTFSINLLYPSILLIAAKLRQKSLTQKPVATAKGS